MKKNNSINIDSLEDLLLARYYLSHKMLKKGVAIIGTGYGLRVIYNCISQTRKFYVRDIELKKNIFTNDIKNTF